MLADAPLAHLLHRRPRTLSLPTGHAPIASGGSNSCPVGYLPPTGSTCPFHGARFLRVSSPASQYPISRPSHRRRLSAILACIGRRCAAADRIADNRVGRTRPIAKIWVNGLNASCDTTREPARR